MLGTAESFQDPVAVPPKVLPSRHHQLLWSPQGLWRTGLCMPVQGSPDCLCWLLATCRPPASLPQLFLNYCYACIVLQVRRRLEPYRGDSTFGLPGRRVPGARITILWLWPAGTSLHFSPDSSPTVAYRNCSHHKTFNSHQSIGTGNRHWGGNGGSWGQQQEVVGNI